MGFVFRYFRQRMGLVGVFVLFCALFLIIFALYGLPAGRCSTRRFSAP